MKLQITKRSLHVLGLASVIVLGIGSILGSGGGSSDGGGGGTTPGATLTSVNLNPAAVPDGLPEGVKLQVQAIAVYSDNSTQDVTNSATWASSDDTKATVSNTGVVEGVAAGQTIISADYQGTSGSFTLDVNNAMLQKVVISPSTLPDGLPAGFKQQLKAFALFDNSNSVFEVTDDASWNSSNHAIATVSNAGLMEGVAAGDVTIAVAYGVETGTAKYTIKQANVTKLEVTQPTNDPLLVGLKRQFTATGIFDDNSRKELTNAVTWKSNNTNVLEFSSQTKGQAEAKSAGSANVTAELPNVLTSAILVVDTKDPDSNNQPGIGNKGRIEITSLDLPGLPARLPIQLKAAYIEPGGQDTDVTETVNWISSDSTIASVSSKGVLTPYKAGTVTITAQSLAKGVNGSVSITVDNTTVTSIELEPETIPDIVLGQRLRIKVVANLSTNTKLDITKLAVMTSEDEDSVGIIRPTDKSDAAYLVGKLVVAANTISVVVPNTNATFNQDVNVVTATNLQSLRVSPSQPAELPVGLTKQFQVIGTYTEGATTKERDVTSEATFISSNEAVATISNAEESLGLVTAKAVGTTNISARVGNIQSLPVPLPVTTAILDSLSTQPQGDVTVAISARVLQFKVTGTYTDLSTKDITNEMTYYSSDTNIAHFDRDKPGLMYLNSPGQALLSIFVKKGNSTYTVGKVLNVTSQGIQSMSITGPGDLSSIPVGSKVQLKATATFLDMTTADMTKACTWSTDNTTRATFTSTAGELIAKAAGSITISCSIIGGAGSPYTQTAQVTSGGGGSAITTGTWDGGTGICFNVSADRTKLTPLGSTCTGNGSLVLTNLAGKLNDGTTDCVINLLYMDDRDILLQQTFNYDSSNADGRWTVFGEFTAASAASGTATLQDFTGIAFPMSDKCSATWSATP